MMANFIKALNKTLLNEGGYSDDRLDPGGRTKYGITEATARANGYKGGMVLLTLDEAASIYKDRYWDVLKLDMLHNQEVAEEVFDTAVNCGVGTSAKFIQKAYNKLASGLMLRIDGSIGPKTLEALNNYDKPIRLVKAANAEQARYYCELVEMNPDLSRFYYGWLDHRVEI